MNQSVPSAKKVKYTSSFKDVSLAEAGKYGTLNDFAFFDKVSEKFHGCLTLESLLQFLCNILNFMCYIFLGSSCTPITGSL